MTTAPDGFTPPPEPGAVTLSEVEYRHECRSMSYAVDRHRALTQQDYSARTEAQLKESGRFDTAKHGVYHVEPLTAAEQLELLALAEYLSREYRPKDYNVARAVKAGATFAQIAAALGCGEDEVSARHHHYAEIMGPGQ